MKVTIDKTYRASWVYRISYIIAKRREKLKATKAAKLSRHLTRRIMRLEDEIVMIENDMQELNFHKDKLVHQCNYYKEKLCKSRIYQNSCLPQDWAK